MNELFSLIMTKKYD